MPHFLGIDAGTTSMKAALFDPGGRMVAVAREEYQLRTPAPAIVECDAETYWAACCAVIRRVASIPSNSGITRSMRTTSGFSASAWATASVPLPASPTIVRPGSVASRARMPFRTMA